MKKIHWQIIIVLVAIFVFTKGLLPLSIIGSNTVNFAGFIWQDIQAIPNNCNNVGSSMLSANNDGADISVTAGGGAAIERRIETDITGIDEILIVYEGSASAYCSRGDSNAGSAIYASVAGSNGGLIGASKSISTTLCPANDDRVSVTFEPSIWKFKNNFDGTWSTLKSIGVGDVFIKENTIPLSGSKQILTIGTSGGYCGIPSKGTSSSIHIYNVVRKENSFAICKADKYPFDVNKDGQIAADGSECLTLQNIVLNSEEAIKESYDEKLARITQELEAKNAGLQADITALQQQLQQQQGYNDAELKARISVLEQELAASKQTLNAVNAGDQNVIATIQQNEQFKKPGSIQSIFNWLTSFFKAIIGFIAIPFLPP